MILLNFKIKMLKNDSIDLFFLNSYDRKEILRIIFKFNTIFTGQSVQDNKLSKMLVL